MKSKKLDTIIRSAKAENSGVRKNVKLIKSLKNKEKNLVLTYYDSIPEKRNAQEREYHMLSLLTKKKKKN